MEQGGGAIKDILGSGRTWEFRFAPGSPRAARAGSRAGAPRAAKGTAPICDRQKQSGTQGQGRERSKALQKWKGELKMQLFFSAKMEIHAKFLRLFPHF